MLLISTSFKKALFYSFFLIPFFAITSCEKEELGNDNVCGMPHMTSEAMNQSNFPSHQANLMAYGTDMIKCISSIGTYDQNGTYTRFWAIHYVDQQTGVLTRIGVQKCEDADLGQQFGIMYNEDGNAYSNSIPASWLSLLNASGNTVYQRNFTNEENTSFMQNLNHPNLCGAIDFNAGL